MIQFSLCNEQGQPKTLCARKKSDSFCWSEKKKEQAGELALKFSWFSSFPAAPESPFRVNPLIGYWNANGRWPAEIKLCGSNDNPSVSVPMPLIPFLDRPPAPIYPLSPTSLTSLPSPRSDAGSSFNWRRNAFFGSCLHCVLCCPPHFSAFSRFSHHRFSIFPLWTADTGRWTVDSGRWVVKMNWVGVSPAAANGN